MFSRGRSNHLQDYILLLLRDRSPSDTVSAERHLRRPLQHRPVHRSNGSLFLRFSATTIPILSHLVQNPAQAHVPRGNDRSLLLRASQEHGTRHPIAIRDVGAGGPVHQGEDISAGTALHDGADLRGTFLRPGFSAVACSNS